MMTSAAASSDTTTTTVADIRVTDIATAPSSFLDPISFDRFDEGNMKHEVQSFAVKY